MSLWLSSTTLMRPSVPDWLELLCQRLSDNDETLKTVEMTHQRIDDNCARALAKALEENDVVNVLMMSCYNMVDDGAFYLGAVLSKHVSIKKLQLRDLRNSREATTFFMALQKNRTIEELSLRHCVLCSQSAKFLKEFMANNTVLRELRIVDTQMTGSTSLQSLCDGLGQIQSSKRLYLVNNDLDRHETQCLNRIASSQDLQEIYICENQIGDAGVLALCQGLKDNQSVCKLDLRSNDIGVEGALALQELVKHTKSLKALYLANNDLGNVGTEALVSGLQDDGCVLERLDISENNIDSTGAKAVAGMLMTNGSIQELNLAFNSIGDEGAAMIAGALVHNTTVTLLSLKRNSISNQGALAFATQLPKMRGLKELIMTKNYIDPCGAAKLLDGLKNNMDLEYLHVEEKVSQPILKEIVHWIRLNKAGRRIFRGKNIPLTFWPFVLARINQDTDAIFHFLSEKPDVFQLPYEAKSTR
ncbi:Ribonuclease inhibitor [Seminavis robusta]|uniref:Ribonuclease inhibitor n=1 Tax=Seminavis robusta TaxID=568900 RepID=A0A9N8HI63_9STRA|nr:Ribonuclease inhibitor [Seminavis robusta]|eukprot:Sro759_g198270.1 Ribonuclease inhibitor (474) ;mRNA; f:37687-39108